MKHLIYMLAIFLIGCQHAASDSHSLTEGERKQKYLEKLTQSDYNKQVMPESSSGHGKPINVSCSMYILDIHKVDDINMEYSAQFYFRQSWTDSRLAFPDQNMSSIVLNDAEYLWTPDLFFVNERKGTLHSVTTPNVFIRIDNNGKVLFSLRVSVTFGCSMDFRKYPHDSQKCTIAVESYAHTRSVVELSWISPDPVGMNKNIDLLPFSVTGIKEGIQYETLQLGTYTRLVVELTIQRKSGFFVTRLYVPFIFLVVISWLSFWIPAKLIAPRLTLLLLVLYLMVNIGEDINGHVPKSSYTKGSDVWIAICESLVFASVLEFIAAHILSRNKGKCKHDPEAQSVLDQDPKTNAVTSQPSNNTVSRIANRLKSDAQISSRMDKASRIMFPVLFIAFNSLYWLIYCTGQ